MLLFFASTDRRDRATTAQHRDNNRYLTPTLTTADATTPFLPRRGEHFFLGKESSSRYNHPPWPDQRPEKAPVRLRVKSHTHTWPTVEDKRGPLQLPVYDGIGYPIIICLPVFVNAQLVCVPIKYQPPQDRIRRRLRLLMNVSGNIVLTV